MDWLVEHYNDILAAIGGVVTAATIIVGLTPSTRDDEILGKVVKFFEFFSVVNKKTK